MLKKDDSNLFILIDQFEEIFRFGLHTENVEKREEVAGFVALLLRLAEKVEVPVYICLTMRSDYLYNEGSGSLLTGTDLDFYSLLVLTFDNLKGNSTNRKNQL